MFTYFRPAAKKQAPKPPQNKNSVYIKYGYFMGDPTELAAQQKQAEAEVPMPEPKTALANAEQNRDSIGVIAYTEVNEQMDIPNPLTILKKKPFILYMKAKGAMGTTLPVKINNDCADIHLSAHFKSNGLHNLVTVITPCCRGGPVIS